MASPVSASEIYGVAKFAFNLFKACKASKGNFDQIAKELLAMRTVIDIAHLQCEDPLSMLNVTDNQEKRNRKATSIHIGNCNRALKDVETCLKRYSQMSAWDKMTWALGGHDEVKGLESNLSSFATQLNGFLTGLTAIGVGAVYEKQKNMYSGIERIEIALENADGDYKVAVKEVIAHLDKTRISAQCSERYERSCSDYAKELSQSTSFTPPRARAPDARGQKGSKSILGIAAVNRAQSTDVAKHAKGTEKSLGKKKPLAKKKPKFTLECWLIQIKSGHLSFLTWEFLEKDLQPRGQWKLEEMARQFRDSKKSKLDNNHDLVNWVLKDRRKKEGDSQYTWYPYAAKKEGKDSLALNFGIEEQAMVIIKRKLTPKARRKADELEGIMQAKKAAAQKDKPEKKAAKKRAKEAAAKQSKDTKAKQSKAGKEMS